jgi:hypothetical protein
MQTPRRVAVLLVLLDVPSVQEGAILNVPTAPLVTISNPPPLQVTVRILVQMDTIQTPQIIVALLVLLDVSYVLETATLNVPAAFLITISNPLQQLVQILVQVMDTM